MLKVWFYGAAGEVTGSNHLVEHNGHKIMVDCGLFQGKDTFTEHNDLPFAYKASEVEALIVTHAHLDHIGRIPKLVKEGFHGPIFATEATIELSKLTLLDSLDIMEHSFRQRNKPMLYEQVDLERTLALMKPVDYHQPIELPGGGVARLYDAGHILGSAHVQIEADGKKIIFSGDIGYWPNVLLPHPEMALDADLLVTEGTYGGVKRSSHQDRLQVLQDAFDWTIHHHGVLLIPAFAIERSQELLYLLHELSQAKKIPNMPIYLDSPLAIEALGVFQRHQELFAKSIQQSRQIDNGIFNFHNLVLTPTVENSKSINNQKPPKAIIAGSGMMEGGRIFHHLLHYLSIDSTLLLVIGYQAQGTTGSDIVRGDKSVEILGKRIPVRAKIEVVDIFSGHADDIELTEWIKSIHYRSQAKIRIVHSSPERAEVLLSELKAALPQTEIAIAAMGDSVEI